MVMQTRFKPLVCNLGRFYTALDSSFLKASELVVFGSLKLLIRNRRSVRHNIISGMVGTLSSPSTELGVPVLSTLHTSHFIDVYPYIALCWWNNAAAMEATAVGFLLLMHPRCPFTENMSLHCCGLFHVSPSLG